MLIILFCTKKSGDIHEEKNVLQALEQLAISEEIKVILTSNIRLMSIGYRVLKVFNSIKEKPFDSAVALLGAFFATADNLISVISDEMDVDNEV